MQRYCQLVSFCKFLAGCGEDQARRLADHVTVCWVDEGCGCVVESGSREGIFVNSSHPITQAYCNGAKG